MSRFSNRILLTLLLGLFFAAPEAVRSQGFDAKTLQRAQRNGQTGNLYGSNPYEQTEGEEGENQQPRVGCSVDGHVHRQSSSSPIFSMTRSAR